MHSSNPSPWPRRHARCASLLGLLLVSAALSLAAVTPAMQMFDWLNATRADRRYQAETAGRAQPLGWSAAIAEVARQHSEEMARAGQLSHTSASGLDVGARLRQAGIAWSRVGENVAMAPTLEQAETMLMDEPPFQPNHRANILDRNFTQVGIGIARAGQQLYITQDFIAP